MSRPAATPTPGNAVQRPATGRLSGRVRRRPASWSRTANVRSVRRAAACSNSFRAAGVGVASSAPTAYVAPTFACPSASGSSQCPQLTMTSGARPEISSVSDSPFATAHGRCASRGSHRTAAPVHSTTRSWCRRSSSGSPGCSCKRPATRHRSRAAASRTGKSTWAAPAIQNPSASGGSTNGASSPRSCRSAKLRRSASSRNRRRIRISRHTRTPSASPSER